MRSIPSVPVSSSQRPLTIVAQDPTVTDDSGNVLTTQISVPAEQLDQGPWGYRVQVIDYDASTGTFWQPWDFEQPGQLLDPYADRPLSEAALQDPRFHAQNVYAIAMRTLAQFEFAFGRRVGWSFPTHQLKIAPHAFRDANAYYDRRSESLQFGYFPNRAGDGNVFTCLSHDIVAHEASHAILDGLHGGYNYPSGPDQAAFHEAFADIVALLSVFSLTEVVGQLIRKHQRSDNRRANKEIFATNQLSIDAMRRSLLLGLAEQFGDEVNTVRGMPLRQSLLLKPSAEYLQQAEFQEPHRRGEILVAAVLNAFLLVFHRRILTLDAGDAGVVNRNRVIEEAAKTAGHLLTIVIRALDYCVPIHLTFAGYLSALVTADAELVGNDTPYGYRQRLLESFAQFGILPSSPGTSQQPGVWPAVSLATTSLNYSRAHFGSFQNDPEEVFRFIWENRNALGVRKDVYTRVTEVKPCLRISPDGFPLRETVVHYLQIADVEARDLQPRFQIRRPMTALHAMSLDTRVTLRGGGTLVFDQYGQLKFNIANSIEAEHQTALLDYMWQRGHFRDHEPPIAGNGFTQLHRAKSFRQETLESIAREGWI